VEPIRTSDVPHAELRAADVLGQLVASDASVPPDQRVSEVSEQFFRRPDLEAVALVDDRRPVALLGRERLLLTLGRNFGYELYSRKPVSRIADPSPLILRQDLGIAEALASALGRAPERVYDEIVVVDREGAYLGLVRVRDLVQRQALALALSAVEREAALDRARDLEKLEHIRSEFLAHATHELRSPVNAIVALGELLRAHAAKGDLEYLRERLPLLVRSASSLRATVNNVLDLSKLKAGKVTVVPTQVALAPLLDEVAATARLLVGERPIEVACEAPGDLTVHTDAQKLRQILVNLASNAAKFTERGRITLGAAPAATGARLWVTDTGIGIRQADLERLFVPFGQLEEALTQAHEGTGLGLVITRSLAHALGGDVAVESRHGHGSTFTVHLPLTPPC
jgi:signal transduction histidine kinase